jgi:multisubunit Na+/H+ antiporter MnhE subunit
VIGLALRIAALVAMYLLVLTSTAPGDIVVGIALAAALLAIGGPRYRQPAAGWSRWSAALAGTLLGTAREMVIGTVRTVRFALGGSASPGFVEIPRGDRSRRAVALWGVLTGEAPDEYPVDVDDERDLLIVHVLDARDRTAIRQRHAGTWDRWQRDVVR